MVQYSLVIKEITDLHVDDDIANFATFVDWIYWIYFVWFDNGDIIIVFSEFFHTSSSPVFTPLKLF